MGSKAAFSGILAVRGRPLKGNDMRVWFAAALAAFVVVGGQGIAAPARTGSGRNVPAAGKTYFVLRETGGFAGLDRQTVIRLVGRVVTPAEAGKARTMRDIQVTAPVLGRLEKTVRDSGFMSLRSSYSGRPVADGMTRSIRIVTSGGAKTVSVSDGVEPPKAFETVWKALTDAVTPPAR